MSPNRAAIGALFAENIPRTLSIRPSFGVMLWIIACDLRANTLWFCLFCGVLVLSGIGRAVSMLQYGLPLPPLVGAAVLELAGIPLLLGWHSSALRRNR